MTNDESITNDESRGMTFRRLGLVIPLAFVIRASPRISHAKRGRRAHVYAASSFVAISLSIFATTLRSADNIGVLGARPRWKVLEKYQETITHDEFSHLVRDVYCTQGFAEDLIKIDNDSARILKNREAQSFFTLRFASDDNSQKKIPRLWYPGKSLPTAKIDKPLAGLRIALDPGHLGGKWAKMEERWFQVGDSVPVQEGDLVLRVSQMLAPRLKQ